MSKILILFTNYFPFEPFEPSFVNESKYIFNSFDKVYIFSDSKKHIPEINLPPNVYAVNIPQRNKITTKYKSFRFLFNKLFFDELQFIKSTLKLKISFNIIKIFLVETNKAFQFYNTADTFLKFFITKDDNVYAYSFWSDYKATSLAFFKMKYPFIKAFSRAHSYEVYFERNTENYLPNRKIIFEKLDKIFFISAFAMNYTIDKFGFSEKRKTV